MITTLFGLIPYLALGPSPQPGQPAPPFWLNAPVIIAMGVIFYLLLVRQPQKKQREHAEMLKSVRPGDKIVTSGGVIGTVITVKEKTLSIRSADSKFEITKAAVTEITERSGEAGQSS